MGRNSEVQMVSKKIYKLSRLKETFKEIQIYFTKEDAALIAKALKVDFNKEQFTLEDFLNGINVELEHGSKWAETDVTKNDPIVTGKIALAHLKEFPDYYVRLKKLEDEAKLYWKKEE